MINMTKSDGVARILAMAAIGSGSGVNVDYSNIKNKPQINGNELEGNKSAADLGLATSGVISNVSYEASTGVLTFEKEDGTNFTIDLPLELLIESGEYNPDTQQIVLTLANKDVITIDVKDLISTYYGDDETIELFVEDEKQKFRIKQTIMDKINDVLSFRVDENDDTETQLATLTKWFRQYKAGKPTTLYYKDRSAQYFIHTGFAGRYDNFWRLSFISVSDGSANFEQKNGIMYGVYRTVVLHLDIDKETETITKVYEYSKSNQYSIVASGSYKTPSYPLGTSNAKAYTPTGDYNPATKLYSDQRVQSIAPNYNATSTYKVGDYVSYQGKFYKCTTAIETAEAWNSEHWSETNVVNEYKIYYYKMTENYNKHDTTEATLAMFNEIAEKWRNGEKPLLLVQGYMGSFEQYSWYAISAPLHGSWASNYLFFKFPSVYATQEAGFDMWCDLEISCAVNNTTDGIITAVDTSQKKQFYTTRYGTSSSRNTNQVLTTDNASSYTPTGDYNPATKKYVDDNSGKVLIDDDTITKNAEAKIQTVGIKDVHTEATNKFWTGTRAEYEALTTYDNNTFYAITDDEAGEMILAINLTENGDGTYNADKTYEQIKAVYESNGVLIACVGNSQLPLMNGEIGSDGGFGLTFGYTIIKSGGQVVSTRSIHYLHTSTQESWTEMDLNGEYLSNVFFDITLTKDETAGLLSNKTTAEIKEAIASGLTVRAIYNKSLIPLTFISNNTLIFTMMSDSQSVTITCDNDVWTETITKLLPLSGGAMDGNINMSGNSLLNVQKIHVDGEAPVYMGSTIETGATNASRITGIAGGGVAIVRANTQSTYDPLFIADPTNANHAATKNYVDNKLTSIQGYDATKTQVLKNINGTLTWVNEG